MTTAKSKLRTGTRMSLGEFLALGETDERMELVDGILYIMPTATTDHQFILTQFLWHLVTFLDSFADPPAQFYPDITTILSAEMLCAVEPDVVIILADRDDIRSVRHIEGVPDVVIEILSTDRNRDLVRKRQIYAEAGVREYWIFDPIDNTVLPLELEGGAYAERPTLTAADTLATPLLPGLEIPLGSIFNHRRRPPRGE